MIAGRLESYTHVQVFHVSNDGGGSELTLVIVLALLLIKFRLERQQPRVSLAFVVKAVASCYCVRRCGALYAYVHTYTYLGVSSLVYHGGVVHT